MQVSSREIYYCNLSILKFVTFKNIILICGIKRPECKCARARKNIFRKALCYLIRLFLLAVNSTELVDIRTHVDDDISGTAAETLVSNFMTTTE